MFYIFLGPHFIVANNIYITLGVYWFFFCVVSYLIIPFFFLFYYFEVDMVVDLKRIVEGKIDSSSPRSVII